MNGPTVMDQQLLVALVDDGEIEEARYDGREPVFETWHCQICGNHVGAGEQLCSNCAKPVFCEYCRDQDGGCDYCNPEPRVYCSLCGEQVDALGGPDVEAACNTCRKKYDLSEEGPVTFCMDPSCKAPIDGEGLCDTCSRFWYTQFGVV